MLSAAQPFRGSRTCLAGHAKQRGRSRRRRQLGGRAAHRERRGQPPKLAWTSASMSGGSVTIMVRFGPRPSALGARARFFWDDGALAGFTFEF